MLQNRVFTLALASKFQRIDFLNMTAWDTYLDIGSVSDKLCDEVARN